MEPQQNCPKCSALNPASSYFCASCGHKLKDKPLDTGVLKQAGVYLISFFLPPFGLIPAVNYLRQSDGKSKYIGIVAIILTLVSIMFSVYVAAQFIEVVGSQLKMVNSYQSLY